MERLLPLSRVARYLSVTEADVEAWAESGQLVPSVELPNGERRWRRPDLDAWVDQLPTVTPRGSDVRPRTEEEPEPTADDELPKLARSILRVLVEADGRWMSGDEITAQLDHLVDHTSGHWYKLTKLLRERGLVESSRANGYRAIPPFEKAGQGGT